ncbi:hypothetical protein ABT115_13715 [Streptomyces sp. NPDC001832]|uniref:Rv1733c family protein n=1 Tax=Streptomyces sp. NPDC001832 TaxID=3154527 RepID=UPI00332BF933
MTEEVSSGEGHERGAPTTRRLPIRASDHIERWGRVLLVVVFLLAAPLASAATGRAVLEAATQSPTTIPELRKVDARLISDAGSRATAARTQTTVRAPVRWTQPDGTERTAVVSVWAGSPAGTTVPVWTTAQGVVTSSPPATHGEVVASAWLTATGTFVVAAGIFVVVWKLFTKLVDSRRCAGWEKEWDEVEAELSRRFRNG